MKYLAIDYGTKRVGVAVSRAWLAEPLAVFPRDRAIEKITSYIHEERPHAVLIGIADGPIAEEARLFAQELQKKIGDIKIIEADETLSSVETHTKLATSGMSRSKRQGDIDHYAAAAFLQDYLDMHKEDGE
ncbi:MAG: Holliday junction resolvase RuvX [Candidatus Pacebacteria bacterium]|nr:Holliday junction resolvase RuvX [Candidatus Paceibacterota bacterium]